MVYYSDTATTDFKQILLGYYDNHKNYGNYVYVYKRNRATTWYIIYNVIQNDVYIEKIISNHLTVE